MPRTSQARPIVETDDMKFLAAALPTLLSRASKPGDAIEMDAAGLQVRALRATKDDFSGVLKKSRKQVQITHVSGDDGGDYLHIPVAYAKVMVREMMQLLHTTDAPFGYELARIAGDTKLEAKPIHPLAEKQSNLPKLSRLSPKS